MGNEFSKILRIHDGEDVHVYLSRFDGDKSEPRHRTAELTFVTTSLTVTFNGVAPGQLRGLARFLREYANRIETGEELT